MKEKDENVTLIINDDTEVTLSKVELEFIQKNVKGDTLDEKIENLLFGYITNMNEEKDDENN